MKGCGVEKACDAEAGPLCYSRRVLATRDQRVDAFRRSIRANVNYWHRTLQALPRVTGVAESDWQSIIRAILYACEERGSRVEAAQLAIGLFQLMQHRGAWREWGAVLQRVAGALTDEPTLRSRVLGQVGQCLFLDGRLELAVAVLEEAEQLAVSVDNQELMVRNGASLAESLRLLRRYGEAERFGRLALEGLAQIDETPQLRLVRMAALTTLGMVLGYTGRPDEGLQWLRQAALLAEMDQRPLEASRIYINIAHVLWTAERLPEALPSLDQALKALAPLPDAAFDRTTINLTIGSIYVGLGHLPAAENLFDAIDVDALRRQGYWGQVALSAFNLGAIYQETGRLSQAEVKLTEAVTLYRQLDDEVELARALIALGETLAAQGRRYVAEPMWREAVAIVERYPADTWAQRHVSIARKHLAG